MTLIVEDGTARAGAESYASVSDADTHFSARGITLWATLTESEKEQALRRATDYMGQAYRGRWAGLRVLSTQGLDWPRAGVCVDGFGILSTVVPAEVQRACIEMAFRAAAGELTQDLGQGVKSKKVGPIEVVYDERSGRQKRYAAVDRLLQPYLIGGDNMMRVVRA